MRSQFGVLIDRGGNFYDIGSGCGKVVGILWLTKEVIYTRYYFSLDCCHIGSRGCVAT